MEWKPTTANGRLFLKEKYFPSGQSYTYNGVTHYNNWVLTGSVTIDGETRKNFLPKLTWIRSQKHIKVKGSASPFDGNHLYWSQRLPSYQGFNTTKIRLFKKQDGRCAICKQRFNIEDMLELDHIIPISQKGIDPTSNLRLLHIHCNIRNTNEDKKSSNAI